MPALPGEITSANCGLKWEIVHRERTVSASVLGGRARWIDLE
jgi:hypothetical protein